MNIFAILALAAVASAVTTPVTIFLGSQSCTAGSPTLADTLDSDACLAFNNESYLVSDVPGQACTFTTYNDQTCTSVASTIAMPAGSGTICVTGVVGGTGAPGPGKSGKFTCP